MMISRSHLGRLSLFSMALLVFASGAFVGDAFLRGLFVNTLLPPNNLALAANPLAGVKHKASNKSDGYMSNQQAQEAQTQAQTPAKPAYAVQKVGFSLGLISQDNAFDMLNNMSDKQLTGYLKNMIPDTQSLAMIKQRAFAKRALQELYQSNAQREQQPYQKSSAWQGKLVLGSSRHFPVQPMATRQVQVYQKIFVHIKTPDTKLHKGRIFVSWIHKKTGEVKIFNMKYIDRHSNKNWVSLKPIDGWNTGTYEVVFYQFDNSLTPLGQISYHIEKVIGKKIFSYGDDDFYEDDLYENNKNDETDDEIDDLDPADYELSEEELKML